MDWRSIKLVVASAISLAVVSKIAKSAYKKFTSKELKVTESEKVRIFRKREINDVLIFPDSFTNSKQSLTKSHHNSVKLIRYLRSAQETLDICMYLITNDEIAESIIRLGQKHVMVRVIVDGDTAYSSGSQVKRLKQFSFIKVQCTSNSRLMHHKFCIIDGPEAIKQKRCIIEKAESIQRRTVDLSLKMQKRTQSQNTKGFVMSGSLNWSKQALHGSCDNVIVTSQPQVVLKFEKEFSHLWEETGVEE